MERYKINIKTGEMIENRGNLGSYFRTSSWREATQEEINNFKLKNAKDDKLWSIRHHREKNLDKEHITSKAIELILNPNTEEYEKAEEVYFNFKSKITTLSFASPCTNPMEILRTAKEREVIYSCEIEDDTVEGGKRKGYVNLNNEVAEGIELDLRNRTQRIILWSNNLEIKINNCKSIEEINSIKIDFTLEEIRTLSDAKKEKLESLNYDYVRNNANPTIHRAELMEEDSVGNLVRTGQIIDFEFQIAELTYKLQNKLNDLMLVLQECEREDNPDNSVRHYLATRSDNKELCYVFLTQAVATSIKNHILNRNDGNGRNYFELVKLIEKATTIEEIDAINWNSWFESQGEGNN